MGKILKANIKKQIRDRYNKPTVNSACRFKKKLLKTQAINLMVVIDDKLWDIPSLSAIDSLGQYLTIETARIQYIVRHIYEPTMVMDDASGYGGPYRYPAIDYVEVYYLTNYQRRRIAKGKWV